MGRRALDSLFVVVGMSIAGCGYLSTDAYIADRGTEVYGGEAASEYRTLLGLSDDKQTNPDKTSNQAASAMRNAPPVQTSSGQAEGEPGDQQPWMDAMWSKELLGLTLQKTKDDPLGSLNSLLEIKEIMAALNQDQYPPKLMPNYRKVNLRCAPPPQQDATLVSSSFKSLMEGLLSQQNSGSVKVDTRFAETVVKLYEQTERSLFLQYTLLRLCEMSINTPVEYRNVFPILMHVLIRQAGSASLQAAFKMEERNSEMERTKQEHEKTVQSRLNCVQEMVKKKFAPSGPDIAQICWLPEDAVVIPAKQKPVENQ